MDTLKRRKFTEEGRATLSAAVIHDDDRPKSLRDERRHEDSELLLRLPCRNKDRETIELWLRHLFNISQRRSKPLTWMAGLVLAQPMSLFFQPFVTLSRPRSFKNVYL
jgi:hypothetical protein